MDHIMLNLPVEKEVRDVWLFQAKFGHLLNGYPTHLTRRKMLERLECMQEELDELREAVMVQDLAAQADALVDLVYFAKGTINMLGLTYVWSKLWDDVQRANMAKEPGVTKRGHRVDCIKPTGWVPPHTYQILIEGGYRPSEFTDANDFVDDSLCSDDEE